MAASTRPIELRPDELSAAAVALAGVAVIRDVSLSPAGLRGLVASLGELMFTPGEEPLAGHPMVFEVTNRGRTTPPRSVLHTDTSYVECPPSFTALAAVEVPAEGGATVLHDQCQAFDLLEPDELAALEHVELLHVASRVPNPSEAGDGAWHPVLRHHPVRRCTTLFVSAHERLVAARRNGESLGPGEAQDLIDLAVQVAARPEPIRHWWERGDALIMDNRSMLHRAEHGDVVGERTLWRVMCRGERPVAARHAGH